MNKHEQMFQGISRRTFLKWTAASTVVPLLTVSNPFLKPLFAHASDVGPEQVYTFGSTLDCGGKCLNKVHVRDGVITRIGTRTAEELNPNMPAMKACVRGRGYRKFQYHPDRLKYPMKRVGKRGEGKFERISWGEAIDIIVQRNNEIVAKYGPESRFIHVSTGTAGGTFPLSGLGTRLFNLTGGHLGYYHSVSMGNTGTTTPFTYGVANTGNSLDSLLHSRLIILWGHNPTETIFGHTNYFLLEAKKRGARIIVVDPRNSDSAVAFADQWIPILPNTDSALMDAMAYVMVTENLHDQEFLDRYCIGFDEAHMPEGVPNGESYMTYLMGKKDGVEKTPEWAAAICKVDPLVIRQFARDYATAKPAALISGWGPQRHSGGERTVRTSMALCCITGNVGKIGGWAGGYGGISRSFPVGIPGTDNPVPQSINIMQWTDAIEDYTKVSPAEGLKGGDKLNAPIKMIWSLAGNYLVNQNPDLNMTKKLLADESKVEFILSCDVIMTSSCDWSDLVLPSTTFFEGWDLGESWASGNFFMMCPKVVEPMFEARHGYDWMLDVAEKLGVADKFSEGRTQEEWIRFILDGTRADHPDIPQWDEMVKKGVHYFEYPETLVTFKQQIEDPDNNPFQTPSGKIELFSTALYERNDPEVPGVGHYVPAWEGPEDPLTEKYPLQAIGWKNKHRDNSSFFTHPWLKQVAQQVMWINPHDAQARGLAEGDSVRVFNDRGAMLIPVKVTSRVIPGVVAVPSGAWHKPGPDGTDLNGCLNVLTTTRKTPLAHGNAHHSCLVQVQKA